MTSPLGIVLLGAGTVGATVAEQLLRNPERVAARSGGPVRLLCVAERDPERRGRLALGAAHATADAGSALATPGADIVVELLGGLEPAGSLLATALDAELGVVTANKAAIAARGPSLASRVGPESGGLAFEAAVGAAIPVLAVLRDSLAGDRIRAITAVINGTTNHILGRLEAGDSFDAAVADAQRRGYAEADPSADLDGHDAAQKLCILAWFGMGAEVTPDQVERQGIREIDASTIAAATRGGSAVRLVARAVRTGEGLSLSVGPMRVPRSHPLGSLEGADNAVLLEGDLAGTLLLQGRGAGAAAAASAVLSDIAAVARARREGRRVPLPAAAPVPRVTAERAELPAWLHRLEPGR